MLIFLAILCSVHVVFFSACLVGACLPSNEQRDLPTLLIVLALLALNCFAASGCWLRIFGELA